MDITGTWYNELGSQMILQIQGKSIVGTYNTRVGDASGNYSLLGQMDTDIDESTAIGWIVVWNNEHGSSDSVTAWCGQVQVIDGIEKIVTTWLLTAETEPDHTWHSTFIGKDTFTRLPPTENKITENLKLGIKHSFPVKR